jgi:hypothetical protein
MADIDTSPYYLRKQGESKRTGTTGNEVFSMIVYGPFGVGKTVLMYSWPRPLGLSFDKGENSVGQWNIDEPYETFIYGQPTFRRILALMNDMRLRQGPWFGPGGKYEDRKTLIIETISELTEYVLYELMALEDHFDFKGQKIPRRSPSDERPTNEQWGILSSRMEDIGRAIRDLKDSGIYVAISALERTDVNFRTQEPTQTVPMLTGKSGEKIMAWVDEVWKMAREPESIGKSRFVIYPYDMGLWKTKSRYKAWQTKPLLNPTFNSIRQRFIELNAIKVAEEEATSEPQIPSVAVSGGTPPATT